jgi:hypothetical protein
LTWQRLGDGYHRVCGGLFVVYVVELDVAGPAEHDDLIYTLGSGKIRSLETRRFFAELIGSKEVNMSVQEMEGLDEVTRELLEIVMMLPPDKVSAKLSPEQRLAGLEPEQRLAGLEPEQRLAGLEPEQRLAGLDRDHQALALPIEVLRLLPDDYIRSLAPEVQVELRRRLDG